LRRDCLLKYVIEGKIEGKMAVRRGRRRGQLLDGIKDKKVYCKLKEEALYHYIALCEELALEKAMDLSLSRRRNEWMNE
jgi:hypothetical protein